ncbi:MAG: 2,3-butanediol dehydrogenase [Dehalococcoidia bacterium]
MEMIDLPEPEPGPGEVVLRVGLCGICGSDLHLYDSPMAGGDIVMGHEFGATVAALGPGVEGWSEGDRVVTTMLEPCGNCVFCLRQEPELCYQHYRLELARARSGEGDDPAPSLGSGGYAPYTRTSAARLVRVPDALDERQAACVEPAAVGFHAVHRSGMGLGDRVAVIGAGPIGLFTLQCAREAGASRVVVAELSGVRARVAKDVGADAVFNPGDAGDVAAAFAEHLGGPPDVVFDAAGVPATLQQAVDIVRPRGSVMMVGVAFDAAPIRPASWVTKNVRVRAAFAYSRQDYRSTMDLMARGRIRVEPLVTSVVRGEETPAAFERLLGPNDEIKVLVDPHA